ncbi:hypothetical protein VDG1235_2812 [Verrucomicrobiia bacterium DG1235]|nr:hypothetical protein VDG1235_2812 [Verrucomicrobiae bacterium DG1235]
MYSINGNKCFVPWVTLALTVVAAGFYWLGDPWFDVLVWKSDWLARGEVWRILTGHLTHVSTDHLVWDLGVFIFLGSYLEKRRRGWLCGTIGLSIVLVDLLLRMTGRFDAYCGLSAIDIGLFASVCLVLLKEGKKGQDRVVFWLGGLGLLLALGKVAFEWMAREPLFVTELGRGFAVATESHLAGFLAAVVVFLFARIWHGVRVAIGATRRLQKCNATGERVERLSSCTK